MRISDWSSDVCSSDLIVAAAHLVEIAGHVEGEHHLLAGAVGVIVDDPHDRPRPLLEGAVGAVALKLVVLDEIDVRRGKRLDETGRLLRPEADAGLDDGSDQGTAPNVRKPACPLDAEGRAGIGVGEGGGQTDILDPEPGELLELEQVAGDGGEEVGQGGPEDRKSTRLNSSH